MATTTNYSWSTPDDTALVKDGAAAIRSLGTAIDTTVFTNAGAAIAKATVDAKGDLIAGTADNTVARLAVGTNGHTLVADSAEATGLKWAAPAGGGKVLQVVSGTLTGFANTTSSSLVDTGLTVSITPTLATSKILVLLAANGVGKDNANGSADYQLLRGATVIQKLGDNFGYNNTSNTNVLATISTAYLDSPATTSSTTYKLQFAGVTSAKALINTYANNNNTVSVITVLEIGV
jgi:hypothetical protein